eukprot:gene1571-32956_t
MEDKAGKRQALQQLGKKTLADFKAKRKALKGSVSATPSPPPSSNTGDIPGYTSAQSENADLAPAQEIPVAAGEEDSHVAGMVPPVGMETQIELTAAQGDSEGGSWEAVEASGSPQQAGVPKEDSGWAAMDEPITREASQPEFADGGWADMDEPVVAEGGWAVVEEPVTLESTSSPPAAPDNGWEAVESPPGVQHEDAPATGSEAVGAFSPGEETPRVTSGWEALGVAGADPSASLTLPPPPMFPVYQHGGKDSSSFFDQQSSETGAEIGIEATPPSIAPPIDSASFYDQPSADGVDRTLPQPEAAQPTDQTNAWADPEEVPSRREPPPTEPSPAQAGPEEEPSSSVRALKHEVEHLEAVSAETEADTKLLESHVSELAGAEETLGGQLAAVEQQVGEVGSTTKEVTRFGGGVTSEELEVLLAERDELRSQLEGVRSELASAQAELLEFMNSHTCNCMAHLLNPVSIIQAELLEWKDLAKSLEAQLEVRAAELATALEQASKFGKLKQVSRDRKAAVADFKKQVAELSDERDLLQDRLATSDATSLELESRITELEARVQEEAARAMELEKAVADQATAMQHEAEALRAEVETVRDAAGGKHAEVERLLEQSQQLQIDLDQFRSENEELTVQLSALSSERDDLRDQAARVPELEAQLTDLRATMVSDEPRLEELVSDNKRLKMELSAANGEISDLRAVLDQGDSSAARVGELEASLASVRDEAEDLRADRDRLAREVELLTSGLGCPLLASLEEQLVALQANAERLQAQAEAAVHAASAAETAALGRDSALLQAEMELAMAGAHAASQRSLKAAEAELELLHDRLAKHGATEWLGSHHRKPDEDTSDAANPTYAAADLQQQMGGHATADSHEQVAELEAALELSQVTVARLEAELARLEQACQLSDGEAVRLDLSISEATPAAESLPVGSEARAPATPLNIDIATSPLRDWLGGHAFPPGYEVPEVMMMESAFRPRVANLEAEVARLVELNDQMSSSQAAEGHSMALMDIAAERDTLVAQLAAAQEAQVCCHLFRDLSNMALIDITAERDTLVAQLAAALEAQAQVQEQLVLTEEARALAVEELTDLSRNLLEVQESRSNTVAELMDLTANLLDTSSQLEAAEAELAVLRSAAIPTAAWETAAASSAVVDSAPEVVEQSGGVQADEAVAEARAAAEKRLAEALEKVVALTAEVAAAEEVKSQHVELQEKYKTAHAQFKKLKASAAEQTVATLQSEISDLRAQAANEENSVFNHSPYSNPLSCSHLPSHYPGPPQASAAEQTVATLQSEISDLRAQAANEENSVFNHSPYSNPLSCSHLHSHYPAPPQASAAEQAIAALESEISDLRAQATNEENSILPEIELLTAKCQSLAAELAGARDRIVDLEASLNAHEATEAELAGARDRVAELEASLNAHEATEAELAGARDRIAELEASLNAHGATEAELAGARDRIAELEASLNAHGATEAELAGARDRLAELEASLNAHEATEAELKTANQELERQVEEMTDNRVLLLESMGELKALQARLLLLG